VTLVGGLVLGLGCLDPRAMTPIGLSGNETIINCYDNDNANKLSQKCYSSLNSALINRFQNSMYHSFPFLNLGKISRTMASVILTILLNICFKWLESLYSLSL
jgi:hypothetical protein